MGMVWGVCKRLRDLPNPPKTSSGARPSVAPAIGEHIRVIAPREKLHLFNADGRQRIEF